MSKTLVIILSHNLPEYTDPLYASLKAFEGDSYVTWVMDNGSKPELRPAVTHMRFEENLFFGGALNEAFRLVLEDNQFDSLLFLNNDIEVTAEVFVNLLRHELFGNDFTIVSPCIAGTAQPWKQMQSWGSHESREVEWIDLQAPMFHRRIIEAIGRFDPELYYGWGQELVCFDVCKENGWKTGVCDHISILHVGKQTLLQNRLFNQGNSQEQGQEEPVSITDSHTLAMQEYRAYFATHLLKHGDFEELRAYGEHYTFYDSLPETSGISHSVQKSAIVRRLLGWFKTNKR